MPARIASWGICALHVLVALVAVAGPVWVLVGSFFSEGTFSLDVWWEVMGDLGRWMTLLVTTGKVVLVAGAVSLPLAYVLAVLLFKTDAMFRRICLGLLLFAACIPMYVMSGTILSWFSREEWLESARLVGLIHAISFFPLAVLLMGAGLRSVPAAHEESALLDGASSLRTLICISTRLGISGIIATGILLILLVSTDYSVADLLMVRTFAEEVYTQVGLHTRPFEPCLVAIPQVVVIGVLLWLMRRWFISDHESMEWDRRRRRFSLGSMRVPVSIATLGFCVALAVFPMVSVAKGLVKPEGLLDYLAMFRPALTMTTVSSITAGLAATGLGVGIAWFAIRRRGWRLAIGAWTILMLAVPAPVLALSIIYLFNRPGVPGMLYDSPAILPIAWMLRFLPVAVLLLIPVVRNVPRDCEDAARLDGCGTTGIWRRIVWPQSLWGSGICLFLLMLLMLGELPCSILVTPPGYITVGVRFFSLVHYGMYNDAIVLCLLSIGLILVPFCALALLLRKKI